ncbi:hypothetical protein ACFPOE_20735 [Caenimonas terrae]|uniref:Lipoprotein n=1 Tax=Caenimonas terrae TaxID=696074 RepID=A0ABW0NHD0_9BURK
MKLLAVLLAAAGLSGCVAYPYGGPGYYGQGYYGNRGYYQAAPYVVEPPAVYIEGGRSYRRGYDGRRDHDRDGDGVRDRYDRRPDDARRY